MPLQNAFDTIVYVVVTKENRFETKLCYLVAIQNVFKSSLSIWACEKMCLKPTSVT